VNARPDATSVLIVGGGPVGLALALDLGWRGVDCLVVEQHDGTIEHPRANAENARSMEFFRRWGIAQAVRAAGTPQDYPHDVVYATAFNGFEIARIVRPTHGGTLPNPVSPERPQRCNQIWLDPILRDRAVSFDTVTLRNRCRFESFVQDAAGVTATLRDLDPDEPFSVRADYLIACCGGHSPIRKMLGIQMQGAPAIEYNLDFFFRVPELWTYHDKGKAALYFFIDAKGLWRTVVQIDGRELWRLNLRGKELYEQAECIDPHPLLKQLFGRDVPYTTIATATWIARDLVADKYGHGRVFLAGDAAHQNTPAGGFGLNTGLGDAVDLGWKLAATVHGWGGPKLLSSYEIERRPIAVRNVRQATENYRADQALPTFAEIEADTAEGAAARAAARNAIQQEKPRMVLTDGTALGYRYEASPIVCDDGTPAPADTITQYVPTTRPGSRAPHAWLGEDKSTIDLFGNGFTLLRLGPDAPGTTTIEAAFRRRRVPLSVAALQQDDIAKLYERRLVLVRPDGHVAWRADGPPEDPLAVVDRVRGA
jgi:2-polyprenyl-6-methoxyphenol hydroxylase-like FAD-dependent oxidoreductase